MSKAQTLVVMRHALRQDEVDPGFVSSSTAWWDPPLAEQGLQQVEALAYKSMEPVWKAPMELNLIHRRLRHQSRGCVSYGCKLLLPRLSGDVWKRHLRSKWQSWAIIQACTLIPKYARQVKACSCFYLRAGQGCSTHTTCRC